MVSLDHDQVRRAAGALLKHVKSSAVGKSSLIEEDGEVVLAQISLHKIPAKVSVKPIPIAIPHPLRQREDCDMCLIVKDNAKVWIKEMMENERVEGLTKVSLSADGLQQYVCSFWCTAAPALSLDMSSHRESGTVFKSRVLRNSIHVRTFCLQRVVYKNTLLSLE